MGAVEDRYIWPYTKQGAYSVKSGYWFGYNHSLTPPPPKTDLELNQIGLKQRIWKVRTLPKIRFFLWRAVSGALAVSDRLQTKGLDVDTNCNLCGQNT